MWIVWKKTSSLFSCLFIFDFSVSKHKTLSRLSACIISGKYEKIQEKDCRWGQSVQFYFRLPESLQVVVPDVSIRAWEGRRERIGKLLSGISPKWSIRFLSPFFVCFPMIFGRKDENIGLLCAKVPMFVLKSTDVLPREVRCFGGENTLVFAFASSFYHLFSGISVFFWRLNEV